MRPGGATLHINEPAVLRQAEPSRQRRQSVDRCASGGSLSEPDKRAAEGGRLIALYIAPRCIALDAEHEIADLLIDADLSAAEKAVDLIIETGVKPVLHPDAVADVAANIDAGPVVDRRRHRHSFDRQVGRKGCRGKQRSKRNRGRPDGGLWIHFTPRNAIVGKGTNQPLETTRRYPINGTWDVSAVPQALGKAGPRGRPQPVLAGEVAIPAGFEPATHGVEIRYSIQLSYGTVRAVTALGIRLVWPSLSSTANMKNPASRQGRRTDFLKFATKADGGPSCLVRLDTHACPPAVRRRGRRDRLDC
jgi:hypothetical protein